MTIDDYLGELDRELRLRRAPRARLLAEVDDHLHDLSAELAADGRSRIDAESQAVARFGSAAGVASRFAQASASTTAHRAVNAAAVAVAGYAAALAVFATGSPPLRDFPQGAASFFALQFAAVALIVALVRSLRWRGEVAAPTSALAAIARAVAAATSALVAAAVAEAAVALSRPAGVIAWTEARWLTPAFAAAGILGLAATLVAARASAQAAAVAPLPGHDARRPTLVDDVDAFAESARLPCVIRRALRGVLRHPWPATLLVAVTAFAAVTLVGAAEDSDTVAGASALGAVEATVILAAFVAFGRLLGLRPARV